MLQPFRRARVKPAVTPPLFFVFSAVIAVATSASAVHAAAPTLLKEAVEHWLSEGNRWMFTQRVVEFEDETVKQERIERYDPSQPLESRWTLVSIDGSPPEEAEWTAWDQRKNKKKKKAVRPLGEYLDLENAQVLSGDERVVRYVLPLQGMPNWLFPIEKVRLTLTINKATRTIEHADATISEPIRVALGLAHLLDLELDLRMLPTAGNSDPAAIEPGGEARAVVTKFGQRVEYEWSDIQRITSDAKT